MKVILFGASGMVGQGVLRECLLDPEVESVLSVGRTASGKQHAKLRDLTPANLSDLSSIAGELANHDACFFCLGISAAGMSEEAYRKVTYDLTLSVARRLLENNPAMTFIYVSGAGTGGRAMWARVKGETEDALLALPFKASFMFRPAFIQPLHGVVSKTPIYRAIYAVTAPLYPVWKALIPGFVSTNEDVGRAMVAVGKRGASKRVLENRDINEIAAASKAPSSST